MEGYWQRVAEMGKDDSPYRTTFAQFICVAETEAEAERLYGLHVSYLFKRCLHIYPGFVDTPSYRTMKTLQAEFLSQVARPNLGQAASLSGGELNDRGVHRCRQSQDRAPAHGRAGTWLEHSDPLDWSVISALGQSQ